MARAFDPTQGLNRRILDLLKRQPGIYPGTIARLVGHDGSTTTEALARLVAYGLVDLTWWDDDGHHHATLTEAGARVLRRRRRPSVTRPSTTVSPACDGPVLAS